MLTDVLHHSIAEFLIIGQLFTHKAIHMAIFIPHDRKDLYDLIKMDKQELTCFMDIKCNSK